MQMSINNSSTLNTCRDPLYLPDLKVVGSGFMIKVEELLILICIVE
jgi:hypothetical protein